MRRVGNTARSLNEGRVFIFCVRADLVQGTGYWPCVRECLNMAKVDAVPELQEFMLPSDVAHRWLAAHSRGNRSAESTKWRTAHASF